MKNVVSFSLRHPLKVLNLEWHNKFLTTKRILAYNRVEKPEKFPVIIYGQRSVS